MKHLRMRMLKRFGNFRHLSPVAEDDSAGSANRSRRPVALIFWDVRLEMRLPSELGIETSKLADGGIPFLESADAVGHLSPPRPRMGQAGERPKRSRYPDQARQGQTGA